MSNSAETMLILKYSTRSTCIMEWFYNKSPCKFDLSELMVIKKWIAIANWIGVNDKEDLRVKITYQISDLKLSEKSE